MRIYSKTGHMMSETARDLLEMGVERFTHTMQDKNIIGDLNYSTKELTNISFCITRPLDDLDGVFLLPGSSSENREWCEAEFAERVSLKDINPGNAWNQRAGIWKEFLRRNNGKFSYTYNERIRPQLSKIISRLAEDPMSRQCVLSVWNPTIDILKIGIDRVPCSLYYHFLAEPIDQSDPGGDIALNMIYAMRSCDFVTHMPNDVWLAIKLLEFVAYTCKLKMGKFFMNISSLHYYAKDEERLVEYMKSGKL
jgi:thymidylate synthase